MARPTAQQIYDRALDYADLTGSAFPSSARGLDAINAALSKLHYLLADMPEDNRYHASANITVVGGTGAYNLPSDFWRLVQAYFKTSDYRSPLRKFNPATIGGFHLTPITGGTVELWYMREYSPVANIANEIDGSFPLGWEDWAALELACRLCIRGENMQMWQALSAERETAWRNIVQHAQPRDAGHPDSIVDVSARWASYPVDTASVLSRELYYRIMGTQIHILQADPASAG